MWGGKSQQLFVQPAVLLCKGERLNSLLVLGASLDAQSLEVLRFLGWLPVAQLRKLCSVIASF